MTTNDFVQRIEEAKQQAVNDARKFADHDQDLCMLCHAHGQDKRSLFLDCFYAVNEVVPEALNLSQTLDGNGQPRRGYYLRLCKTCRGRLLETLRTWADDCRTMRPLPKDGDGAPQDENPDRNIPVRIDGATVKMTPEEYAQYVANK
jgi:hypothetical protein